MVIDRTSENTTKESNRLTVGFEAYMSLLNHKKIFKYKEAPGEKQTGKSMAVLK